MLSFQCLVGGKSVDIQRTLCSFCFQSLQSHLWTDNIYIAEIISISKKFAQQFASTYLNANISRHTFSNWYYLQKYILHLHLMFIWIKTRQTTLTNLVSTHQIIIKFDNAAYIFTKTLRNDVLKVEIFIPLHICLIYFLTKVFKWRWNITNSE